MAQSQGHIPATPDRCLAYLALEDGRLKSEDLGVGGETYAHRLGIVQRRALEEQHGLKSHAFGLGVRRCG